MANTYNQSAIESKDREEYINNILKQVHCVLVFTITSFQMVANNVTGITLPNTGHFISEERPNFLTKQIIEFFK
jgi:hypothetical protein